MGIKHSMASKKRWAKVSPEDRSERMRKIAIIKYKKMTKDEKVKHINRMNKARNGD